MTPLRRPDQRPASLPVKAATGQAPALEWTLAAAADALAGMQAGRSLTESLALTPADLRPGALALSHTGLRHWGTARVWMRELVARPPPPWVDAILKLALALVAGQSDGTVSDAPHTLVNQTVTAVKRRAPHQAGLVNAVLRRVLRESESLRHVMAGHDEALYNLPPWWLERLRRDWPRHWAALAAAARVHPPLTLRVNRRREDAQAYVARLESAGLRAHVHGPQTVVVDPPVPVHRLPGFDQGLVSVQDAAAQRAAPLLLQGGPGGAPLPAGARVLDACSAPGGKTAHLLELAELDLLAVDQDPVRLKRVESNLARLGLRAELRAADAAQPAQWWDGRRFAGILLDAPCSASGIVRRHPDIPWLRRAEDPAQLAVQQARLLDALWPLLDRGGVLVYATCSLFKDEGQGQIDAFLQRTRDAQALASPGQLLPLDNQGSSSAAWAADGFYYARLGKAAA